MIRRKLVIAVAVLAGLAGLSPTGTPPAVSQEGATLPALVSLTATGTGVETYPAFAPSRRRFGVRTTARPASEQDGARRQRHLMGWRLEEQAQPSAFCTVTASFFADDLVDASFVWRTSLSS